MASIAEAARTAATSTLDLLGAAAERGDLAGTIAHALRSGHLLFLLADDSHAAIVGEMAAALGRRFPEPRWPPRLALTPGPRGLALIGCDYGAARPLTHQVEALVRPGDVLLAVAAGQPSPDLLGALGIAAAQGAVVAGLGLPPSAIQADPVISLPEAPTERLVECQLALANALAETLAQQLPPERPADLPPALERFRCANCNAALAVPRHLAGRRGMCPHCYNNTILAPDSPAPDNESRSHMRFALRQCRLAVALAPENKPPVPLPGRTTFENLSPGGLLFSLADSAVELQPDDPLLVEITTPAFRRPLAVRGRVNRVTREATLTRIGVVFGELPPASAERLRILESNLVLRHLAPHQDEPPEGEPPPSSTPDPDPRMATP